MSGAHRARFAPRRGHARFAPRGDGGRRGNARKRSRTLPPPHFSVSFVPSTTPNGGIGVLRACSTQNFWAVCQRGKGQSAGGAQPHSLAQPSQCPVWLLLGPIRPQLPTRHPRQRAPQRVLPNPMLSPIWYSYGRYWLLLDGLRLHDFVAARV